MLAPPKTVQLSHDFRRVDSLPRRASGEGPWAGFAGQLSVLLRRPSGTQTLRPIQAWALHDAWQCGGLLAPMRVGHGKTLVTFLAPLVMQALRPVLILPAKLVSKTRHEMRLASVHWRIPTNIRIMSYEELGRVERAAQLEAYAPDLVIADECHKLKNRSAAVTRRVGRLFEAPAPGRTAPRFVGLSGTITKRALKDFAHLAAWALRAGAPVPLAYSELKDWGEALDESFGGQRPHAGPLAAWAADPRSVQWMGEDARTVALRQGYQRRLTETPGVVTSADASIGVGLTIDAIRIPEPLWGPAGAPGGPPAPDPIGEAFRRLRSDWVTPDDHPLTDGIAAWRCARELALGFFYRWDPRPPDRWIEPRRRWACVCRGILRSGRYHGPGGVKLDSEMQVSQAIKAGTVIGQICPDRGRYAGEVLDIADTLAEWHAVRDTFVPNTEAVWLASTALDVCAKWAKSHSGIIWTEQTAFASKLANQTGLPYYGSGGVDRRTGRAIEAHTGGPLIASSASNAEGRNLQRFCENLETSCPANGLQLEQKIARTHRDGQAADEVTYTLLMGCAEHVNSFEAALADSRYTQQITGHDSKILLATIDIMGALDARNGPRWGGMAEQ